MARSMDWSHYSRAKGEPARAWSHYSSSLGVVIAGVDRPLGLPWADPHRLSVLEEPMCPQGWLLCSGHAVALG
jgi:hypothetical protein